MFQLRRYLSRLLVLCMVLGMFPTNIMDKGFAAQTIPTITGTVKLPVAPTNGQVVMDLWVQSNGSTVAGAKDITFSAGETEKNYAVEWYLSENQSVPENVSVFCELKQYGGINVLGGYYEFVNKTLGTQMQTKAISAQESYVFDMTLSNDGVGIEGALNLPADYVIPPGTTYTVRASGGNGATKGSLTQSGQNYRMVVRKNSSISDLCVSFSDQSGLISNSYYKDGGISYSLAQATNLGTVSEALTGKDFNLAKGIPITGTVIMPEGTKNETNSWVWATVKAVSDGYEIQGNYPIKNQESKLDYTLTVPSNMVFKLYSVPNVNGGTLLNLKQSYYKDDLTSTSRSEDAAVLTANAPMTKNMAYVAANQESASLAAPANTYSLKGTLTLPNAEKPKADWEVIFNAESNGDGNFKTVKVLKWGQTSNQLSFELTMPDQQNGSRICVFINSPNTPTGYDREFFLKVSDDNAVVQNYGSGTAFTKANKDTVLKGVLAKTIEVKGQVLLPDNETADANKTVVVNAKSKANNSVLAEKIASNHFNAGASAYPFTLDVPENAGEFYIEYWIPPNNRVINGKNYLEGGIYSATGTKLNVNEATLLTAGTTAIQNINMPLLENVPVPEDKTPPTFAANYPRLGEAKTTSLRVEFKISEKGRMKALCVPAAESKNITKAKIVTDGIDLGFNTPDSLVDHTWTGLLPNSDYRVMMVLYDVATPENETGILECGIMKTLSEPNPPVVVKSSNTDLASITLGGLQLQGFDKVKTEYFIDLLKAGEEVTLVATVLPANKSSVTVNGVKDSNKIVLKTGVNLCVIEVTAENGTKKTTKVQLNVPPVIVNNKPVVVDAGSNKLLQVPQTMNKTEKLEIAIQKTVKDAELILGAPADNMGKKTVAVEGALAFKVEQPGTETFTVELPTEVKISAPAGLQWDGKISLPSVSQTVNETTVSIGLASMELAFDKPVRIVLPGMGGKNVKWSRGVVSQEITKVLLKDSLSAAQAELVGGIREGKITIGNDLIVWTTHFTDFTAYVSTNNSGASNSGSNSNASSSGGYSSGFWNSGSSSSAVASTVVPKQEVTKTVEVAASNVPVAPETSTNLNAVPKATSNDAKLSFTDVGSHWAKTSIANMVTKSAISGQTPALFSPDKNITRAEFVSVLVKAFHLSGASDKSFKDIEGHWAKQVLQIAFSNQLISGYDKLHFKPDAPITREEMAVLLAKMIKIDAKVSSKAFKDQDRVSNFAKKAVDQLVGLNVMSGYNDQSFKPQNKATRAEAIVVVEKVLQLLGQ